jgi:hypothetical protein
MNLILQYSAVSLASFAGLVVGMLLIYANIDELKPARKYLIISQKIVWAAIITVTALVYSLPAYAVLIILLFTVLPFADKRQINSSSMYLLLGIIFYLSAKSVMLFALNAGLIFLFGLPTGTLSRIDEDGNIKKEFAADFIKNLGFFISIPLFFLL